MSNRAIFLIVLTVTLGAAGVWLGDWFKKPTIEILAQSRPMRGARNAAVPGETAVDPVSFMFDNKYALTEIRVVAAEDEKTNKYPHALWHLVADKSAAPDNVIVYGRTPRGMKPKIPRARPEPLEPDVVYHLYVTADDARGDKKFKPRESMAAR